MAASDRKKLIGGAALCVFVVTLTGGLYLLVPSTHELESLSTTGVPSELSLQHLKALVAANPGDQRLRLLLARDLFVTGDVAGADAMVKPLLNERGEVGAAARRLAMDLVITRFRAREAGISSEIVAQAVRAALADPLDHEGLEKAAKIALESGEQRLAAEIYERLAREDRARRATWLAEAARWHRAAGDEKRASVLYEQAAQASTDPAARRTWGLLASEAAEGSGDPALASAIAERLLREFPKDPALLRRAERSASASRDLIRARELNRELAETVDADDPEVIAKQIEYELAAGDLGSAMVWLQRLAALRPDDPSIHLRMAQIGERVNDRALALREYLWLIEHGHREHLARSIALARASWDTQLTLRLLLLRAASGDETDDQVLEIVQAYEDVAEPEEAASYLGRRLARATVARRMWKKAADLGEQRGAPEEAVDAWEHLAADGGLDGSEAIHAASLLWRLDRPREALDVLLGVRPGAPLDLEYWTLLSDLALENSDDRAALRALIELRARGDRSLVVYEHLIEVEKRRGNLAEAARLASEAYGVTSAKRMLFLAAELLAKLGNDEAVLSLLDDASSAHADLLEEEGYWTDRAQALEHLGRLEQACLAYDEALRHRPDSAVVFEAALACAVARHDRSAIERHVMRWKDRIETAPELYGTYAIALVRIGRDREATRYIVKQLGNKPNDYMWTLELADALERLGDADRAYHLRRHAWLTLWPRGIAALKAPPSDATAKADLIARAISARRFEGVDASYRWLEHLLPKEEGRVADADVADLAVSYYLADGNSEAAKRLLLQSRASKQSETRQAQLTLALLDNNLGEIERLLLLPSGTTTATDIEALIRAGHDPEAFSAVETAITSAVVDVERATVDNLHGERLDIAERIAPLARATYALDAYGPVLVHGPRVEAALFERKIRFEGDFQRNEISSDSPTLPVGSMVEYEGRAGLRYSTLATQTRLTLGVNARNTLVAPLGTLSHEHKLGPRLTLKGELSAQDVTQDATLIRVVAFRDSATVDGVLALTPRDTVDLGGSVFREHTASQDDLAYGGSGTLTVAHELLQRAPNWGVFTSGMMLARSFPSSADATFASLAPFPPSVTLSDLLPGTAYLAIVGTRLRHGDPTNPWGSTSFPRYSLSLGGGRLWPANDWNLEARVAAGTRAFGNDIFGLSAYYATGLAGAAGEAFRGLCLYYALGI